jgi:glycosyltransferase involved in cell wall biosynthesis
MPETGRRKRILYYCGGFHYIGGVESFAAELITSVPDDLADRWVAAWSRPVKSVPLLAGVRAKSQRFERTFLRWGCRWAWPDKLLLRYAWRMAQQADVMVFPKVMPFEIHYRLRSIRNAGGRPIPAVLVVPYRPAEMWNKGVPRELLDCFDAIVLASPSFSGDLRKLGYRGRAEVISLISMVPARPVTALPSAQSVIRLGFLGRLDPQKNLRYMMKVIEALGQREKYPFELHMFGDGIQRQEIEQLVSSSPFLSGHVTLHGMVGGDEKWEAIDSCHVFLNTATTEGQYLAGLEILSRGRPVVATGVGALPDILDTPELGALMPLDDPAGAAGAIAEVIDRVKSGSISPARIRAIYDQRYGREVTLAKWVKLLGEMLELSETSNARASA